MSFNLILLLRKNPPLNTAQSIANHIRPLIGKTIWFRAGRADRLAIFRLKLEPEGKMVKRSMPPA